MQTIRASWWLFVLAGWLLYAVVIGVFAHVFSYSASWFVLALVEFGQLAALGLIGVGSYALCRKWLGVVPAIILAFVAAFAQYAVVRVACFVLFFPRI